MCPEAHFCHLSFLQQTYLKLPTLSTRKHNNKKGYKHHFGLQANIYIGLIQGAVIQVDPCPQGIFVLSSFCEKKLRVAAGAI